MENIHPTSQHIALYLMQHGEKKDSIGNKGRYLELNLDERRNICPVNHGFYIPNQKLTVSYRSSLHLNPLNPSGSWLEIELDDAENEGRRIFHTKESDLRGIPSGFTLFGEVDEEKGFNTPIDIIDPLVASEELTTLLLPWKHQKYHKFLESVFQQLIQR